MNYITVSLGKTRGREGDESLEYAETVADFFAIYEIDRDTIGIASGDDGWWTEVIAFNKRYFNAIKESFNWDNLDTTLYVNEQLRRFNSE